MAYKVPLWKEHLVGWTCSECAAYVELYGQDKCVVCQRKFVSKADSEGKE